MKWRVKLPIYAPIVGLTHPQRHYPVVVRFEPVFKVQEGSESTSKDLFGEIGFDMRCDESWEQLPLLPWKPFVGKPNPTDVNNAQNIEAAIALGIFNARELNKQQPLPAGKLYHQLTHINFPQNIQEALAFALFDLRAPFEKQQVYEDWQKKVRRVIYERDNLLDFQQPESALLRYGYQLLKLISKQRQTNPSLDEFVMAWDEFNQQATLKLPFIFAIVYWSEAAYRLTEIGDMAGAQTLLDKQNKAVAELFNLIPQLSNDLVGGLWQHYLGRLAYYRGDFAEALQQYGIEWQLRQQHPASKKHLQYSIAKVLLKMGYLSNAEKLAQQAFETPQHNHEPDTYGALLLGEIQTRQRKYAQAIDYLSEARKKQSPKSRDGKIAIHLGHTHILQSELAKAKDWYRQAEKIGKKQNIGFNPYLLMGQIALAQRQSETKRVKELWQANKDKLDKLTNDKVLPMAVIATAVYLIDEQQIDLLDKAIEKLIAANYFIEVIYPLTIRFAKPALAAKQLQHIIQNLKHWQPAIEELQKVMQEEAFQSTAAPTPLSLLAALATVQQDNDWQALSEFLPLMYPMNLLSTGA